MAAISSGMSSENCHFCEKKYNYSCPRCNVLYCSKDCYNSPSHAGCSEDFYKEMIQSELKCQGVSIDDKKKMEDILEKLKNEDNDDPQLDSDDDSEEVDLADRIAGIDLDDTDALWSRLTKSEQKEFEKMLQSGDMSKIMPVFEPWWMKEYPEELHLVQELKDSCPGYIKECPTIVDVPDLTKLTNIKPAACILNNILNVLAAYAWIVRIFHGEHHQDCYQATEAMLSLSSVLNCNANFDDKEVAIDTIFTTAQNIHWLSEGTDFRDTIKKDIKMLETGPNKLNSEYYKKAALSDIIYMLNSAKKLIKHDKGKQQISNLDQLISLKDVKLAIKKLEYYLCIINQQLS